jgi:hypothetical protein
MLGFMEEIYVSCVEAFGATTKAWVLVCHCVRELFTKELKPCLKYSVKMDLLDVQDALVGVVHCAFSLNCKIRELTSVGLKNHHSTTTSHIRFVMKMAKSSRTVDSGKAKVAGEQTAIDTKLQATVSTLQKENKELKSYLQRLESRLDSIIAKNDLEVAVKGLGGQGSKRKVGSAKDKASDDAPNKKEQ